ncbi:hypothetical protein [Mesotoga prima]|uniref:hypothetical protein n=1 Tax=Mesotoga prima TaxID=1184387 RepID=UPI002BB8CE5F|nr:hypothetical protein [Mesotoga prima]HNS76869.1 hypothetical protein [Mesotoga prima]
MKYRIAFIMMYISISAFTCGCSSLQATIEKPECDQLRDWLKHLFGCKAELVLQDIVQGAFSGEPIAITELSEVKLLCDKDNKLCLLVNRDQEVIFEHGKKVLRQSDPDSSVYLVDKDAHTMTPLLTIGSDGHLHGAFWCKYSIATCYGTNLGKGFVIEIDLIRNERRIYTIKKGNTLTLKKETNYLLKH